MIDINELTRLGFVKDAITGYYKEVSCNNDKIKIDVYCHTHSIALRVIKAAEGELYIVLPYRATTENIKRLLHALSDGKEGAKYTKDGVYIQKTAIYLRQADGWEGTAGLYRLYTPVEFIHHETPDDSGVINKTNYVVVSDCSLNDGTDRLRVFPTDKNGTLTDTHELIIVLGNTNPEIALNALGYVLVE